MFKNIKINKLLRKLDLEFNNKNYDDALNIANDILYSDKNNKKVLYKKALILFNKMEYEESLSVLNYLLAINRCIDALLLKGRIHCHLEDYENSLNFYKEASINFDFFKFNNEMVYYATHPFLFEGGVYTKIFLDLCNMILENEDIIEVRLFKSYVLSEINRNEDALNNINYILARDSNNEKALSLKSSILINLNQYEDALILINKSLKLNPNNIQFIDNKANLFYELGEYDKAEELCNEYNLKDGFGNYQLLSRIKYKKEDYFSALQNIDIALDKFYQNPNFDDRLEFAYVYYRFKSLILLKLGEIDKSYKIIDCLIEKEPENAKNYCLKAMILFEEEKYEESLDFIQKTLDLNSDCEEAIELKGKIETKM